MSTVRENITLKELGDIVKRMRVVVINTTTRTLPDHTVIRKPSWDYSFGSGHFVEALGTPTDDGMVFITIEMLNDAVEFSEFSGFNSVKDFWKLAESNTMACLRFAPLEENGLPGDPLTLAEVCGRLWGDTIIMLTNASKFFGAGSFAVAEPLFKRLANALKDDIYIIPSSVHEVLLIAHAQIRGREDALPSFIEEVNATKVCPTEVLGDRPYVFKYKR